MKLEDDLCAHYLNLDFSEDFLSDNNNDVHIQLPYPINKPLKDSKIDMITKFNEDLETYNNHLLSLHKDFPIIKDRILNQSFTNTHATITKSLLNFCNKDKPEPSFACDYNPYYSGGLLEHFYLDGTNYLVRPDNKNNLRITNIVKPWKNGKLNLDYQTEDDITGVSSFNDCGTIFLLLKHKKDINLVKITDFSDVQISQRKKFKKDVLYTKFNKEKIGVITSNTKLQLYNIESGSKQNLPLSYNFAVRFEFIDDDTVAVLGQKNLKIIDLRSNDHKLFQPDLNNCNYLCSMKTENNLMYVGSRHHLIRTDVRFLKSVEFCTHLMKSSPCYIDLIDNFLCLSGQKIEEKVLFYGKPINSLPLNVPSICDSLNKCKLQNDILLRSDIKERLQKSVGGIRLIRDTSGVHLYSVNSLGDIFKQKIDNSLQSDPIESFLVWINNLPDASKPLQLTNVSNLGDARFALNQKTERKNLLKFSRKSKKVNYFLNHYQNRYHKNNLGELAANFVSIWEDEEEEREDVDIVPEVAPLDKVNSWIQSNNYFFD